MAKIEKSMATLNFYEVEEALLASSLGGKRCATLLVS